MLQMGINLLQVFKIYEVSLIKDIGGIFQKKEHV